MANQTTENSAKSVLSKPQSKTKPLPKNRLRSYLSHANLSSHQTNDTTSFTELEPSESLQTASFEPNLDAMCARVRLRLLKYPDTPFSRQYTSTMLRIIEHCSKLASEHSKQEDALRTGRSTPKQPFSSFQNDGVRHCQSCCCSEADLSAPHTKIQAADHQIQGRFFY